jgi:hypothetical protein
MGYRGDVGTPNAVTIIPVMATTGEIFFPMILSEHFGRTTLIKQPAFITRVKKHCCLIRLTQ